MSPSEIEPPTSGNQPLPPETEPSTSSLTKKPKVETPIDVDSHLVLKYPNRRLWLALGVALAAIVIVVSGAIGWFLYEQQPVSSKNTNQVLFTVKSGSLPGEIATDLQQAGLIRNTLVFDIYTRLDGSRSRFQAGTYRLSPSDTLGDIVHHLTLGLTDHYNITFFPGATLTNSSSDPKIAKSDATSVLENSGYSLGDIKSALNATYTGPLFADKPAGTSLEGYIYGDTYRIDAGSTVSQILNRSFDEMYSQIQGHNLIPYFKSHNLNLYQAITLASIIQREVSSPSDQKQVAQVFYKRLGMGMPLGSDVTFIYAAHLLKVTPSSEIDSPYNTRVHVGLPSGPIGTPGLSALEAVAHPASGDYLYFLAGDDGKTYFATTFAEHEANIKDHCKTLCK